jgi:predicted metal-dependent peptidase/predicted RNA-binding Zn-ribbon protein involved in translation (DUF1610 family)
MLKKLEKAINQVLMFYDSLGYFIFGWEIKEDKKIDTLATSYDTLLYNPDYCNKIKVNELAGVIIHECVHCMFLHPRMLTDKQLMNKVRPLWIIALEMVTNAEVIKILENSKQKHNITLPGEPFSPFDIPQNFDFGKDIYYYDPDYANLTSIEIYEALIEEFKDKIVILIIETKDENIICEGPIICPVCGNKIPKNGKIRDKCPHCGTEIIRLPAVKDTVISCEDKNKSQEALEKTIAVLEKLKKSIGDTPLGLERFVKRYLQSQVPWHRILLSFVYNIVSGAEEYRWEKPDFRHPLSDKIIMPGLVEEEIGDIIFVVDTSASITENQLSQITAEISKVFQYLQEVTVITTDATIHERVKARNLSDLFKKLRFIGGGGTDFRPLFSEIKKCAAMVFFTDGMAYYPEKPPGYPVLWVLTKENVRPPFGKVCYVLDI